MITTLQIGSTSVYYAPIPQGERGTRRQRETATVHAIVRHMLGPNAAIDHDEHGAPRIDGWHISVTHSQAVAAVAIDPERSIGIDAEEPRPEQMQRIVSKFLNQAERAHITTPEQMLAAWTIKEAVYKAAGVPALDCLNAITIHPGLATATALGITYAIHTITLAPTLITLAIPK